MTNQEAETTPVLDSNQIFINLPQYQLWDFAGVDGLHFAKTLVGDAAGKIAAFQSIETTFGEYPCSLLRLGEGNFRIGLHGDSGAFEDAIISTLSTYRRVWVRRCEGISAIAFLDSAGLDLLPKIAITKLPYRLAGLALNCAVPARITGISVLIWRHPLLGNTAFELHTAARDTEAVKAKVWALDKFF